MKSYGYDLLVQADEKLMNKALSALFYTGQLKKSGMYSFVKGIPEELQGFTEVKYRIRLKNEPFLDLLGASERFGKGKIGIRISVEAILNVLSGVDVELDVDCGASAEVQFDLENKSFVYDLSKTNIYDIKINDRFQFHKNVLERLDQILKILLAHYITEDIKRIELPLDLLKLNLPTKPDSPEVILPIKLAEAVIVDNRLLAIGINFFDHSGGSLKDIADMAKGTELFLAVKTELLHQIAEFWWKNSELDKFKTFDGVLPVNIQRYFVKGAEFFSRILTLGLLQPDTDVKKAELFYDVKLELTDLPEFIFEKGSVVRIKKLKLKADIQARLDAEVHKVISLDTSGAIPDKLTPWKDDIKISEKTGKATIFNIKEDLLIEVENASCNVQTDKENRLVLKISEADVELDLGSIWYQNLSDKLTNAFLDILEKNIVSKIPPIVISPSLLISSLDVMGYTFGIEDLSLDLNEEEAALYSKVAVNELKSNAAPVSLYIGNTKSNKLHRFDCAVVEDIDFTHRVGYHGVYDAIRDGYKPCGECLRGYLGEEK
jgi:hypothetical protein